MANLIEADLVKIRQPEKEAIISAQHQGRLGHNIHETLLAIDSMLDMAVDGQYREALVKTAYALRTLEEAIQRSICCQD